MQLISSLPLAGSYAPEYLEQYRILPLEIRNCVLIVAAIGQISAEVEEDLAETFGVAGVELVPVDPEVLFEAISRTFSDAASSVAVLRSLGDLESGIETTGLEDDTRELVNQPPVIRYVHLLLREANDAGASDLHLEASDTGLRVRLRIDGVLTDLPSPPRQLQSAVLIRVKLLAQLDIANRRTPQDGRIRIRFDDRALDLRVATLPTAHGETIVLRLLDHGGRPATLDQLGMPLEVFEPFRHLALRPHGIVLATGPTGSGKTTTLYAALGLRDTAREKIITIENPVEYRIERVVQIGVDDEHGVSFESALRSLLRHDPDVLLIGETRDQESARIAIQAAMTGHLVFSSLHTNDAVSALTRLADLGIEPYLIAAAVEGVLAQRLVRRICPNCRESYRPEPRLVALLSQEGALGLPGKFERGAGCSQCRDTGFRGRTGVYELFVITDAVRHAMARSFELDQLRALARAGGMTELRHDGWRKVLDGITTMEEVARAVGL